MSSGFSPRFTLEAERKRLDPIEPHLFDLLGAALYIEPLPDIGFDGGRHRSTVGPRTSAGRAWRTTAAGR